MLLYFLVLYCAFLCLCLGVKLNNAKAQEAPIEDATPLENAPVEGDEDAAARYRSYGGYGGYRRSHGGYGGYGRKRRNAESEEASVDRAIPLENVPIEGDEDAAARYRMNVELLLSSKVILMSSLKLSRASMFP
ncbi:hypothetical protein QYM36_018791 [Artemia franciscana]|uniref:Uncharacterized protein n=1 Tax=Artemia franciscana TaxID=6661 RepID=A0AA88HBR2_ARTSF|nr:hypothetical protein QYM36_018791 [Artemia franciscana]